MSLKDERVTIKKCLQILRNLKRQTQEEKTLYNQIFRAEPAWSKSWRQKGSGPGALPAFRLRRAISCIIVITFYLQSDCGQETAKGLFGHRVKLQPAPLPTTHGGGFTLFLLLLNVKQGSCEY